MKKIVYLTGIFFLGCQSGETTIESSSDEVRLDEIVTADPPDESEIAETTASMDMGLRKLQNDDLPDCDYNGNLIDCWTWEDKNQENYFFRTVEEAEFEYPLEDGTEIYSQTLHVYHYIQGMENTYELIRELTDFEKECDFDITVEHIEKVVLEDLDNDNLGEITFGYRLACRSDVSPSTQKVVTFEAGDKYILRGSSVTLGYGGDYQPGEEYNTAPEGFLKNAIAYWDDNKIEIEIAE